MTTNRPEGIHLFRLMGIDVYLHWSWFLVAMIEVSNRSNLYSSILWNVYEYLALFLIVLMHEFGHSLACQQVGGTANHILLWPFGGVAYVSPPQRPGANLWSIAAGPLVNVVLVPVLMGLVGMASAANWPENAPDTWRFLKTVQIINYGLLFFNVLPIYPLDGGQILRSLLWFVIGRSRSLMVAVVIGFIGLAGVVLLFVRSVWSGLMAAYIGMSCWNGLQQALLLMKLEKMPRWQGYACPSCRQSPLRGTFWKCNRCEQPFDTFETQAVCPHCGERFEVTRCIDCGALHPITEWSHPTGR